MLASGRGRWVISHKPQFLLYLLFCKQLSSEGENIKTTTMRFFQLLLKVANHAALLAPTVRQTLDQQEKVGRRRRTLSGKKNDEYNRISTNGHLSTTAIFLADSPYIDYCFNVSTMVTFFCPQGGRCRDVQLY